METIQQMLDTQAAKRLDKDLEKLFGSFSQIVPSGAGPALTADQPHAKPTTLYFLLKYEKRPGADFYSSTPFMDALRADMLPDYRAHVAKEFLEKINNLELTHELLVD